MGRSLKKSCPICGKTTTEAHTPFCSNRCRDEDLGKWLGGGYVIPSDEPIPEGNDENE